ncbi:phage protease [Agarivorans sp. QJM3NY_25]|uniref:phage protease n=1 Tax=Agarivorans sp. QJM3NY_25 TaxID=3421430 RepID=UPI003D7E454C
MKTFQLAALNALTPCSLAVLSAELSTSDDGWVQLLPHGKFKAVDGRPTDTADGHWHLDAASAQAMLAATPHQSGDLVIDYEHQTLRAAENGQANPASGFFSIRDSQYRAGQGLFIKPRWTDKARAMLDAGEYKYLSAVFAYGPDGKPQFLHSAALTNRPGVDGMQPLVDLAAQHLPQPQGDTTMPQWLVDLCAKLGITIDANAAALSAEQGQQVLAALTALNQQAEQVEGLQSQLAALSAEPPKGENVDLSQYVPVTTYQQVCSQLASLSAENGKLTIEQTVKTALDEGRVLACEQDYLTALGKQQGIAALSAHLAARNPIHALTKPQTSTVEPPNTDSSLAALSVDEQQLADAWGLCHEDYAKAKAADSASQ